jgi:hypothetical protein
MDPVAEGLWARVLEAWDDDARHAAFIAHCRIQGDLGTAARRYRAIADDVEGGAAYRTSPERAAEAKKRLGSITTMALLEMQATATTPEDTQRPKRWLAVAAVAFFTVSAAVLVKACS